MANYNKSFNFRNGVQVDNDNFIVNANGLVGIGTSIPVEFLDVHGTTKVTGLVTARNLAVTGVSTFYSDVKIGSGITFNPSTGAVRATTFYGSSAGLTDIYAIAVDGWHINSGNISTTSKVGIGTTLPYYSLQVGIDPLTGNGLSVDAITGNVNTTGILTALSFVGNVTGNVTGNINSTGVSTFVTLKVGTGVTITDGNITSTNFVGNVTGNINSTGVSTFATLKVGTGVTITNGIVTATSFSGSLTGNVTGNVIGNVTGTATTATTLPSTARISIDSVNSGFTSTGIATVTGTLYATKIGIGTTTAPAADIEVNKTGISSIRVISSNSIASIGIGRSAEIRTGNTDTLYSYSGNTSLDIINSSAENINYYLDYGSAGLGTGNFNWIHGQNPSNPLMSLTYDGNLGLGITNPSSKLYVSGTSYINGITTINSNLDVNQSLYVYGNITFNGSLNGDNLIFGEIQSTNITSTNINNSGIITASSGFSGNLTGNVTGTATNATNVLNGVANVSSLYATGVSTSTGGFTSGIGVTNPVKITVSGNKLIFIVLGVGSTSLTLY
jgi:hypothetical protein